MGSNKKQNLRGRGVLMQGRIHTRLFGVDFHPFEFSLFCWCGGCSPKRTQVCLKMWPDMVQLAINNKEIYVL